MGGGNKPHHTKPTYENNRLTPQKNTTFHPSSLFGGERLTPQQQHPLPSLFTTNPGGGGSGISSALDLDAKCEQIIAALPPPASLAGVLFGGRFCAWAGWMEGGTDHSLLARLPCFCMGWGEGGREGGRDRPLTAYPPACLPACLAWFACYTHTHTRNPTHPMPPPPSPQTGYRLQVLDFTHTHTITHSPHPPHTHITPPHTHTHTHDNTHPMPPPNTHTLFQNTHPPLQTGYRLQALDFDKDVDAHMAVVTAVSNLRASNYKIPEVSSAD